MSDQEIAAMEMELNQTPAEQHVDFLRQKFTQLMDVKDTFREQASEENLKALNLSVQVKTLTRAKASLESSMMELTKRYQELIQTNQRLQEQLIMKTEDPPNGDDEIRGADGSSPGPTEGSTEGHQEGGGDLPVVDAESIG